MKLALATLTLLILLSACGLSPEQQAINTATALTATAAAWTPTPTATNTPTPTFTPPPTDTATPTPIPTDTATPEPTQDPSRYYPPDNSFSILAPEGWVSVDLGLKYPGLLGPAVEELTQNLVFIPETSTFPLAAYAAMAQDGVTQTIPEVTSLKEEFLQTTSGIDYFRWIIEDVQNGRKMRQVFYIFENGDQKLTIIYTRQPGDAPEQDAVIDQLVDTIQFATP